MPIQASKTLKNGVTGNYWRFTQVFVDADQGTTTFILGLYLDSTHGTDGVTKSLTTKTFALTMDLPTLQSTSLSDLYQDILTLAASSVPNIGSGGTHTLDPDLASGTLV